MTKESNLKLHQKELVGALILGAGASTRMNGIDKIFATVAGIPLVVHSIRIFDACPKVDSIVLVLPSQQIEAGRKLVTNYGLNKVYEVCAGGHRRQDSVRLGLERLRPCSWVIVHDGARPNIDEQMLLRGLEAARETGAAVAGVPAKDTMKVVLDNLWVQETLPRDSLWQIQTPQIFNYHLLVQAHNMVSGRYTDDGAMVESLGNHVRVFEGAYSNIKVTTPEDLLFTTILIKESGMGGTKG